MWIVPNTHNAVAPHAFVGETHTRNRFRGFFAFLLSGSLLTPFGARLRSHLGRMQQGDARRWASILAWD